MVDRNRNRYELNPRLQNPEDGPISINKIIQGDSILLICTEFPIAYAHVYLSPDIQESIPTDSMEDFQWLDDIERARRETQQMLGTGGISLAAYTEITSLPEVIASPSSLVNVSDGQMTVSE